MGRAREGQRKRKEADADRAPLEQRTRKEKRKDNKKRKENRRKLGVREVIRGRVWPEGGINPNN